MSDTIDLKKVERLLKDVDEKETFLKLVRALGETEKDKKEYLKVLKDFRKLDIKYNSYKDILNIVADARKRLKQLEDTILIVEKKDSINDSDIKEIINI